MSKPAAAPAADGRRENLGGRVKVEKVQGRVVIRRFDSDRRIDELAAKEPRTEAETLELILLRLGRIEAAMLADQMHRRQ